MLTHHFQIYSDLLSIVTTICLDGDNEPIINMAYQRESGGRGKTYLDTYLKDFIKGDLFKRYREARVMDTTEEYQDILHDLTGHKYSLDINEEKEFVRLMRSITWVHTMHLKKFFPAQ